MRKIAVKQAMILAAGLGTRMRPLTLNHPKPLIKLFEKPLIDYAYDRLCAAGVNDVVVNVHAFAEQVIAHVEKWPSGRIRTSDEREALLDSGGGVKKALPFLENAPFFVINSDGVWLDGACENLARMAALFDPARMDMLMLLAPTVGTIGWANAGDFLMDQEGLLSRPASGETSPFAYCGVALLQKDIFTDIPEIFSLRLLFNRALGRRRLYGLRIDGRFLHVGTPAALKEAERFFTSFQENPSDEK